MADPNQPETPELQPEDLAIRGKPKPVKRFNKKTLGIMLGGAGLLVFSSFGMALRSSSPTANAQKEELYSTSNNATAEGLAVLPTSYAEIKPEVPELGPALPGDLGAPILKAQLEGRLPPRADPLANAPDPQIADQEAALIASRHRSLFFNISTGRQTRSQGTSIPAAPSQPASTHDPFAVLNSLVGDPVPPAISDQDRKRAFTEEVADESIYNPHLLERPVSPWQLMAGSVIPATLLTAINSDLPGQVVGQVTEPVYDTVTGDTLLIPQGTRIIGRYDSAIAFGQSRALIVWNRLIMPDGSSIRIDNLPAVDGRGNAGLKDRVNNHSIRLFTAAALSSLISIGAEVASNDDDERIARALREAGQDGVNAVGQAVVNRELAVQPTLTIRPGWRLRILAHQDIILKPYGGQ
ncbi:MAG: TrbI/VirB10 family protein [Pseudomonadota bacterium]